MQHAVVQRALAQTLAGMDAPARGGVGPANAGVEDPVAGERIDQEQPEEDVAEGGVAESVDDGPADLLFGGRRGDLRGEAEERRLAAGGVTVGLSLHGLPTSARTSESNAWESSACFWTTRSTPPLSRRRSSSVRVLAVMTTTGIAGPVSR